MVCGCLLVQISSNVVKHVLYVEARLFVDLVHEDGLCRSNLGLPFFKILTILGVQKLRVTTLDLFIILEESLVIDQVLESLPDFLEVDILVVLHLHIDLLLLSQSTLVVHLEGKYFILS